MSTSTTLSLLEAPAWRDYALLDSGDGQKLERFGPYTMLRPEAQATWSPVLGRSEWSRADAIFRPSGEESGGHWDLRKKLPDKWEMTYPLTLPRRDGGPSGFDLRFWAMTTPGRHLGLFPEAASQWDFIAEATAGARSQPKVLNLFGYTGLASLAAAAAGAQVTHLDASKKSVEWARQNQALSGLESKPIRWIVDDALKFVQREIRRGAHYDGLIIDPPKFGRGPKGEVWEVYKSLPKLMQACRELLSPHPLFVVLTIYAVRASGIHLAQTLNEAISTYGRTECGELVTREQGVAGQAGGGRMLSQAVFARWRTQ